jgi:hypothetical protein
MGMSRQRFTYLPFFGVLLCLTACDLEPEYLDDELEQVDAELVADIDPLDPIDAELLDADAIEAPPGDEQTVSCGLGLPNVVVADANNAGTAVITLSGIPSFSPYEDYHFEAYELNDLVHYQTLSYWYISSSYAVYGPSVFYGTPSSMNYSVFAAVAGDTFDLVMQAPAGALPGWSYEVEVQLHDLNGVLCSDTVTMILPPDCGDVNWWSTNPWPDPWFDGANCYVAPLPEGAESFVWNNGWYVEATNGNQCAIGVWDTANCYIGSAPDGHTAFIWHDAMYYTP